MLTGRAGAQRRRPPARRAPGRRPARRRRGAALAMAAAAGAWLPLAAVAPARADQIRQQQLWVLNALDVPAAWRVTQGRGVLVAVIDSGVDPTVADLAGSVISGPDLTGVHTPPSNPQWGMHGTWMASLIAGHGHGRGGRDGIIGVAPRARILSIRVITDRTDPGYARYQAEPPARGQQELATAIRYAVKHGAQVISMSLGYQAPSLVVRAALQYAVNHNVVVVASSGNSGTSATLRGHGHAPYSFPADYPGVIGVAAVGRSGRPAYFSSENLSVEVAAPGVNVPAAGRGGKYWVVSGTSPACALTAGVAALVRARYPRLPAAQVRLAISSSARHSPRGGYDDKTGFGIVDAAAALAKAGRLAATPPASDSAAARAAQAGYFGGGRAGVPAIPVAPRDRRLRYLLAAAAAACLLITAGSAWRLTGLAIPRRRAGRPRAGRPGPGQTGVPPPGPPGAAGPATGLVATAGHPSRVPPAGGPPGAGPAGGHLAPGAGPAPAAWTGGQGPHHLALGGPSARPWADGARGPLGHWAGGAGSPPPAHPPGPGGWQGQARASHPEPGTAGVRWEGAGYPPASRSPGRDPAGGHRDPGAAGPPGSLAASPPWPEFPPAGPRDRTRPARAVPGEVIKDEPDAGAQPPRADDRHDPAP